MPTYRYRQDDRPARHGRKTDGTFRIMREKLNIRFKIQRVKLLTLNVYSYLSQQNMNCARRV